jgi:hypothetical protein
MFYSCSKSLNIKELNKKWKISKNHFKSFLNGDY